ncbi:uncharacterized protein [Montipora capricornis]|uniref:uncharacterized protein n=1 Tax=Montipora capricornis TaxID=246305 RepID=UPI0035F127CA
MAERDGPEGRAEGVMPGAGDWLHHTDKSLSRLKDIKKTSYRLGGGPREREVGCQCNYRSKSKSSYLQLNPEPPQIGVDSQETASMSDLSISEIMRQFNERKSQMNKSKRRPYSASVYTSMSSSRKFDSSDEKHSTRNNNAFITVKGQTVTPQFRQPHGFQQAFESKTDDTAFKGLLYLDEKAKHQSPTFDGLLEFSAAFNDDEDDPCDIPPPPNASPEADSPGFRESIEHSLNEDDDEEIDKSSEVTSSWAGCRSLVFAIPTGNEGGSEDEIDYNEFKPGRVSADYVRKSEFLLEKVDEKNLTEAVEISDMLQDMESAKQKIGNLRISPRDLIDLDTDSTRQSTPEGTPPPAEVLDVIVPSVHITDKQISRASVEKVTSLGDGSYEAFWVEEPVGRVASNALPPRNNRACSAKYLSQREKHSARVKKHESEGSLVLKGKIVEFFNSEDLIAGSRDRHLSRTSETKSDLNQSCFTDETRNAMETTASQNKKMVTKRPLPQRSSFKADKRQSFKGKDNFQRKNTGADKTVTKSSLRKSNSDGFLQLSVTSDSNAKKSVTFSQDVLTGDSTGEFDCNETEHSLDNLNETTNTDMTQEPLEKRTPNSRLWSHPGVVIQNGFEMREAGFQGREGLESSPQSNQTSKDSNQQRKSAQSSRAKLLAKLKESPIEKEPCACRTVTRPTAALLAEARKGDAGTREKSTRNERLLKSRSARPSSAPMRRSSISNEHEVQRPKSPSRKPRAMSAIVQRKRTGSHGAPIRPRPLSAHVGSMSSKDARRNRAAVKVLKEGYLLKERPPPPLPPGSREQDKNTERKGNEKEDNNNLKKTPSSDKEEHDVVASEECRDVYARLQERGIKVSMDTIKRGLMPPARKANDYSLAIMGTSSGLLSRPENWLPEEHARIKIWNSVLKGSK